MFDSNAPVNPNLKYTMMSKMRKYSCIISAAVIVLAVILVAVTASSVTNDMNIDKVKNGYFESYSSTVSVGEAFDEFFSNPEWTFYDENGKEYVLFTGGCFFGEKSAEVRIVFEIEGDWYHIRNLFFTAEVRE